MKITIGFTQRQGREYVPSMDGWKAGAEQDAVEISFPDSAGLTVRELAEAVFVATNAPSPSEMVHYPGALEVYKLLEESGKQTRALSIGDTVTVKGCVLACVAIGWRDVTDGADAPPYDNFNRAV